MRRLFRLLSVWNDAKAASRGPDAYTKRQVRKHAHRTLARLPRKL